MDGAADPLELARQLRAEAEALLVGDGLLEVVRAAGPARVGGSAALDLMVRRELDVAVQLPDARDTGAFFLLGAALVERFVVLKASYSNHFVRGLPGFNEGLFWGIWLLHDGQRWKLDLWGHGPDAYHAAQTRMERLAFDLRSIDRRTILTLKLASLDGDGYRGGLTGFDIYQAALAGARDPGDLERRVAGHTQRKET